MSFVDNSRDLILAEIKKDFGFRSIFQGDHWLVSHFTNNSGSNFSFLKE